MNRKHYVYFDLSQEQFELFIRNFSKWNFDMHPASIQMIEWEDKSLSVLLPGANQKMSTYMHKQILKNKCGFTNNLLAAFLSIDAKESELTVKKKDDRIYISLTEVSFNRANKIASDWLRECGPITSSTFNSIDKLLKFKEDFKKNARSI